MSGGVQLARAPQPWSGALRQTGRGVLLPVVLLAIWFGCARLGLFNTRLISSPEQVFSAAVREYRGGAIVTPLLSSLARNLVGLAIGTAFGLLLGALLGASHAAARLLGPSFNAARQVAVFAWLPLISVWLGVGEPAKIAFIALCAFYPVVINTWDGVRSVSHTLHEVADVYALSRFQRWRALIVPGSMPAVFAGLRLALIYAWLGTLGAEYLLAAAPGIGNLMTEGREALAMDKVLVGVAIAGGVGALLAAGAARLERRVLRWRPSNIVNPKEAT